MIALLNLPLAAEAGAASGGHGEGVTGFLIGLLAVLAVAWVSGRAFTLIGYPSILGELLAGIIFGPPLLGWIGPSPELRTLAEVGVFLLMLYVGMEIDPRELTKASWSAFMAAAGGFLVPGVLATVAVLWLGEGRISAALVTGIIVGATSLAVQSRILFDLKLLDLRIAHVLMAAALVADAAALILYSALRGMVSAKAAGDGFAWDQMLWVGLRAGAFLLLAVVIGSKLFPWIGRKLNEVGFTGRTALFTMVLMVGLLFAEAAALAGLDVVLGAFIAGLFLREGVLDRKLSKDLTELVHDLSVGFLAPVFFVSIGFAVDLTAVGRQLPLFLLILLVAMVGKIAGTVLFYSFTKNGWREGLVVGIGMNGHGAVEAVIAGLALKAGLFGGTQGNATQFAIDLFSLVILMAIITTATVPALLRWGTAWLKRRGELLPSASARTGILIIGATPLARVVARQIGDGKVVTLVDNNRDHCAAAESDGLRAVNGNALHEDIMAEAGGARAGTVMALTPNLEVNVLAATMAREAFLVPHVHVLVSDPDSQALDTASSSIAVHPLFGGPVDLADWDLWIARGEYEVLELLIVEPTTGAEFFKHLGSNQPELPILLRRDTEEETTQQIISTRTQLKRGDTIVYLRRRLPPKSEDPFDQMLGECRILDIDEPLEMRELFERIASELAPMVPMAEEQIVQHLLDREAESSAVLSAGLAVPHLRVEGQEIFHLMLVRARSGVQFLPHEPPVFAVFVLISSRDERNMHLRALSCIASIAQSPMFEKRWLSAANEKALRQIVQAANRRRPA